MGTRKSCRRIGKKGRGVLCRFCNSLRLVRLVPGLLPGFICLSASLASSSDSGNSRSWAPVFDIGDGLHCCRKSVISCFLNVFVMAGSAGGRLYSFVL